MKRNERISLEFTDLTIESTLKVTNFINDFLNIDWLDKNIFDETIKQYTLLEQYFICEYGKKYYSKHRLKNWLNHPANNSRFEPEMIETLFTNAEKFVLGIEGVRKSLWRILAERKRKGSKIDGIRLPFNQKVIDFRLPLYFPPLLGGDSNKFRKPYAIDVENFGNYLQNHLHDIFSDEDIHYFLFNSYKFKNNLYPIQLLYIEVDNITLFKNKMHQLYSDYSKFYEDTKKRYQDHYAKEINDLLNGKATKKVVDINSKTIDTKEPRILSEAQRNYYSKLKKTFELPEITKYDFAKILYNSFPHIREEFTKKLIENPDYKLDVFIKKVARRIR